MRILQIVILFLAPMMLAAQIQAGSLQLSNFGDHYQINHIGPAINNCYPKPDSTSLRLTVICVQTGSYEVNHIPIDGVLKYRLGGGHIISASVIWWKNGVKKSQTNIPMICGFYLNPQECFSKI